MNIVYFDFKFIGVFDINVLFVKFLIFIFKVFVKFLINELYFVE